LIVVEARTHLEIEAEDCIAPLLPNLTRGGTLVVQDCSKSFVICVEGFVELIEIARAPSIVVDVPLEIRLLHFGMDAASDLLAIITDQRIGIMW
jgi:hypothetical protein